MSIEIKVPTVGESINEVTLAEWLKADGDYVEMDETIAELESDKATFELPAEKAGVLRIVAQEGDTLEIGALIGHIEEGNAPAESKPTPSADSSASTPTAATSSPTSGSTDEEDESNYAAGTASPAAAKILREKGINPSEVKGTGKDGRITKNDAEKAQAGTPAAKSTTQKGTESTASTSSDTSSKGNRNERRTKMSSLRKTVSRRLVAVKNETAMLTTFNEVNMQPIMDIRAKYKDMFKEKHGVGLGFMSFFAKAVTTALKEWPDVNARIEGEEIVYNDFETIISKHHEIDEESLRLAKILSI